MDTRTDLFPDAELRRLEKKKKRAEAAAALIGGLALLCCVLLCVFTRTANAQRMELSAIGVSILGGWAVMSLLFFPAASSRHELRHAQMLRGGPEETVCGAGVYEPGALQIRGSIRFRTLRLRTVEGEKRVKVCASRASTIPEGRALRVYTVNGYAAAFEEL